MHKSNKFLVVKLVESKYTFIGLKQIYVLHFKVFTMEYSNDKIRIRRKFAHLLRSLIL